jgi:glutathione-regulated potassium-efflux system ancillary protein KefC
VEQPFAIAALWVGLALVATLLGSRFKISNALMEITVGLAAGTIATRYIGPDALGARQPWLVFIASTGAVVLTFLAGAELDPATMRTRWKEVLTVGLVSFAAPFLGCSAIARFALGWSPASSWLAGIALSTTSMAVVYAVMLETGFNKTEFGKGILGACFVTDLGTVLALGLMFAPFTWKTVVFVVVCIVAFVLLPLVTPHLIDRYANRTAAFRTKWVLFILFGLGALSLWAGSEAVLPAYIAGMLLSKDLASDHHFIRRLRTLTIGFLSPFYFLRAGSLVSVSALVASPLAFLALLSGKLGTKVFGLVPVVSAFRQDHKERWYYTLMMSTGLTFGTISALFGLTHGIVTEDQYSHLVAVVIGSAVVPTLIAGAVFLPRHLLTSQVEAERAADAAAVRLRRQADSPEPLEEG